MNEENWNQADDQGGSEFSQNRNYEGAEQSQEPVKDSTIWQADSVDEGPQPMPSSDNMYRFQNVRPEETAEKKSREKKSGGMKRTIVAAVVFGVVAALCFFALVKITGVWGPEKSSGGSIGTVEPFQTDNGLTAVSGGAAGPGDVSSIVEAVMPSIVSITETSTATSYFGQSYPTEGAGSGFIVKEDNNELLIVTNNHVVAGADSITVTFIDDTTAKATVKGTDPTADLAVISVKVGDLKQETRGNIKVASLGHSEDVKVGQMAIAIGNALGYGQSVTVGYISAKDRQVEVGDGNSSSANTMVLLQTDAAINPGNSGGALLDVNGNVIGINSVKYADTKVEGIGYAIPMSNAIPIINELMNREVLKDEEKGYLGITGRTIGDEVSEAYGFPNGIYISEVSESGAAKKAGIKQGDIITKINGNKVTSTEQVQNKVNNTKAGTEITVTIARSQEGEYKEQDVKVVLKSSETLDELDNRTQEGGNSGNDSGGNNGGNPFGYGNDSYGGDQIVPW